MKTVSIKNVEIGAGTPKIIVPLVGRNPKELIYSADRYQSLPCDLIEWRADFLDDDLIEPKVLQDIAQALADILPQPLIFTLRTRPEGGNSEMSLERYSAINQAMIATGLIDAIDIELFSGYALFSNLVAAAKKRKICVIASNHDFRKTPNQAEILKRLTTMHSSGASIAKVAFMPKKKKDVLTLLSAALAFAELPETLPVIAISMGEMGRASRLLAGEFGFAATFAAGETASAPGQFDFYAVKNVLDMLRMSASSSK